MPNLVETVRQTLVLHAIRPECLHLEVTENEIMQDPKAIALTLGELKQLGVKLDIDDFGTGHSSLSCLRDFPVDILKIDRSFVENVDRDRSFAALLQAVVTLADNLGLQVVAEGIEDAEQVSFLQALGCHYGQGYYFGKPMPADEVPAFKCPTGNTGKCRLEVGPIDRVGRYFCRRVRIQPPVRRQR